jgi:hypothetical protein
VTKPDGSRVDVFLDSHYKLLRITSNEADGAVIAGGTPIADAVAFGRWKAARPLPERSARTNLWQAAALGLAEGVRDELNRTPAPAQEEPGNALWCAAHGGQRETAELLLNRGARPVLDRTRQPHRCVSGRAQRRAPACRLAKRMNRRVVNARADSRPSQEQPSWFRSGNAARI